MTPARARSSADRAQVGFTLLELIVALAVFIIGLAAVAKLQVVASEGVRSAGQVTLATNLATSTIERLQLEDFDTLADGSAGYDYSGGEVNAAPYYTVVWAVTGTDVKEVTVTVSWSVSGESHSVELESKIAKD